MARYDELFPGSAKFTAGSACSGMYRGLRLWEAAVTEAGSLDQDDVISALDHAKIADGPGGPAEMVPGQHHVRMNMYIAQARDGAFEGRREPRGRSSRTSSSWSRVASFRREPFAPSGEAPLDNRGPRLSWALGRRLQPGSGSRPGGSRGGVSTSRYPTASFGAATAGTDLMRNLSRDHSLMISRPPQCEGRVILI